MTKEEILQAITKNRKDQTQSTQKALLLIYYIPILIFCLCGFIAEGAVQVLPVIAGISLLLFFGVTFSSGFCLGILSIVVLPSGFFVYVNMHFWENYQSYGFTWVYVLGKWCEFFILCFCWLCLKWLTVVSPNDQSSQSGRISRISGYGVYLCYLGIIFVLMLFRRPVMEAYPFGTIPYSITWICLFFYTMADLDRKKILFGQNSQSKIWPKISLFLIVMTAYLLSGSVFLKNPYQSLFHLEQGSEPSNFFCFMVTVSVLGINLFLILWSIRRNIVGLNKCNDHPSTNNNH